MLSCLRVLCKARRKPSNYRNRGAPPDMTCCVRHLKLLMSPFSFFTGACCKTIARFFSLKSKISIWHMCEKSPPMSCGAHCRQGRHNCTLPIACVNSPGTHDIEISSHPTHWESKNRTFMRSAPIAPREVSRPVQVGKARKRVRFCSCSTLSMRGVAPNGVTARG